MRERVSLVGGKLEIWSERNGGTEVTLTVPAANAYEELTRSGWWFLNVSRKGKHKEIKIEP